MALRITALFRQRRFLNSQFSIPGFILLAALIAFLPLPLAAAGVFGVVAVLLALIDPLWGVCWALLAVPLQDRVALPGGVNGAQAGLLLAGGAWALHALADKRRRVRFGPLALPGALLLLALALSSSYSPYSVTDGLKETARWAGVLLIYAIVAANVRTPRQAALVAASMLLAPTAEALLGLWQFVTADGPPTFLVAGGRFARAYGTIGQPNSFAGYMNMAWPLAVALAGVQFVFRPWSLLAAGAAALLLAALGASFSRGGWVGAAGGGAALLALWAWYWPKHARQSPLISANAGTTFTPGTATISDIAGMSSSRRLAQLSGLVLAVVLGAALIWSAGLLPASVSGRLNSIAANLRIFDARSVDVNPENFAVVERMAQLQAGWRMASAHPLLGVGPGNFTNAYGAVAVPPWYDSRGHAHNYYLHMAAEAGVVGLLAYLALLAAAIYQGLRALRKPRGPGWRALSLGCCGIIAAVMTHNMFENLHVLYLPLQLGAAWGLLVAAEAKP